MLDTVVRIGSPDEGEAEVNIAKESGRARFDQQPMSLSMSGGFNMDPEAASTYTQEPQLPGAADSAIVAKSIQAKSLPMASTNPMPNPPAVGAGYNAARGGSKAVVPGDTPGDAPADVPVDTPVDIPFDTPFDTAIVPSVLTVSPSPSGQDESAGDRGAAAAYAGCLF